MNYEIRPDWDTNLVIAFTLGNVNVFDGLVYDAIDGVAGAPVSVVGKYIPGAIVRNAASGVIYSMTGTTASPAWTAL